MPFAIPSQPEPWMLQRVLTFLNRAESPEDLMLTAEERGETPQQRGIGGMVAARILELRGRLPGRRFTHLSQLQEVPGFGQDKLEDLLKAQRFPAAELFRRQMYAGIIGENFDFQYDSIHIEDPRKFQDTVQTPGRLQRLLALRVEAICLETFGNAQAARLAARLLEPAYAEVFEDAHLGSFAFGLWLYRIDADNWFSFETVRKAAEAYLNTYDGYENRMELRLYKGFDNRDVLARPITPPDLPVTVSYAEQSITLWRISLAD